MPGCCAVVMVREHETLGSYTSAHVLPPQILQKASRKPDEVGGHRRLTGIPAHAAAASCNRPKPSNACPASAHRTIRRSPILTRPLGKSILGVSCSLMRALAPGRLADQRIAQELAGPQAGGRARAEKRSRCIRRLQYSDCKIYSSYCTMLVSAALAGEGVCLLVASL